MASGDSEARRFVFDIEASTTVSNSQVKFNAIVASVTLDSWYKPRREFDGEFKAFWRLLKYHKRPLALASLHNPNIDLLKLGMRAIDLLAEVLAEQNIKSTYRIVLDEEGCHKVDQNGESYMLLHISLNPVFLIYEKGKTYSEMKQKLASSALEFLKSITQCSRFVQLRRSIPEITAEQKAAWPPMVRTTATNMKRFFDSMIKGPMTDPCQFQMDDSFAQSSSANTDAGDEKAVLADLPDLVSSSDSDSPPAPRNTEASDSIDEEIFVDAIESEFIPSDTKDVRYMPGFDDQSIVSYAENLSQVDGVSCIEQHWSPTGPSGMCYVSYWCSVDKKFVFSHQY